MVERYPLVMDIAYSNDTPTSNLKASTQVGLKINLKNLSRFVDKRLPVGKAAVACCSTEGATAASGGL